MSKQSRDVRSGDVIFSNRNYAVRADFHQHPPNFFGSRSFLQAACLPLGLARRPRGLVVRRDAPLAHMARAMLVHHGALHHVRGLATGARARPRPRFSPRRSFSRHPRTRVRRRAAASRDGRTLASGATPKQRANLSLFSASGHRVRHHTRRASRTRWCAR